MRAATRPAEGAMNCAPTHTTWRRAVPRSLGWLSAIVFAALVCLSALSTQPSALVFAEPTGSVPIEVFAGGLVNPRGLVFGPDGSLYVAEAGTGGAQLVELGREKPHAVGRSGRISRIAASGERTTVVDNLP